MYSDPPDSPVTVPVGLKPHCDGAEEVPTVVKTSAVIVTLVPPIVTVAGKVSTIVGQIAEIPVPTVLVKLQLGVVFNVKVFVPEVIGVPVAVKTTFWLPVPAKVPDPENVTPLVTQLIA